MILVLIEHAEGALTPASLATIHAASQLQAGDADALVIGTDCRKAADQCAALTGIGRVRLVDQAGWDQASAESVCDLLQQIVEPYTYVLAPASTWGKNILPRLSALMDVQQISEISAVLGPDRFERPIYAGNAVAEISTHEAVKLITVRGASFEAAQPGGASAPVEPLTPPALRDTPRFLKLETSRSGRPDLTAARVVISGGRGMQASEHFALLEKLADLIGDAAVGASRAAVDAGFVSNDHQVGQTGKVVAPELYIAVGISGAIQHLAGMKDSRVIVAINKDEEAPIFQVADYGLVGDLFRILPELTAALEA